MALADAVQVRLRVHHLRLVEAGWSESEAWALSQRVEQRIMDPLQELTQSELRTEDEIEAEVERRLQVAYDAILDQWPTGSP